MKATMACCTAHCEAPQAGKLLSVHARLPPPLFAHLLRLRPRLRLRERLRLRP